MPDQLSRDKPTLEQAPPISCVELMGGSTSDIASRELTANDPVEPRIIEASLLAVVVTVTRVRIRSRNEEVGLPAITNTPVTIRRVENELVD